MKTKIKDTVDNIVTEGIFITLQSQLSWLDENDAKTLNIEYYANNGEKTISPVYEKLLDISNDALTDLANIIVLKYGHNWEMLYKALIATDYNPIENYSMIEKEGVNSKIKTTGTSKNGTYGFNSDSSVPTSDGESETVSEGSSDDNNRLLTRSGNIGVTSSQQMIEAELVLRKKNFIDNVINDVNRVLTLSIYD